MPTITTQQRRALEALDWLLDEGGPYGQGRTFILAAAYLRKAVRVGGWIEVQDVTRNSIEGQHGWAQALLLRAIRDQAQAAGITIEIGGPGRFLVPDGTSDATRQQILEGYQEDSTLRVPVPQPAPPPLTTPEPWNEIAPTWDEMAVILAQIESGLGLGMFSASGAWLEQVPPMIAPAPELCWTCRKTLDQCKAAGKCQRIRLAALPPPEPVPSAWERLLEDP